MKVNIFCLSKFMWISLHKAKLVFFQKTGITVTLHVFGLEGLPFSSRIKRE